MKRVSYGLKKTSLIMLIGLQTFGIAACGTRKENKTSENVEQNVNEEDKEEEASGDGKNSTELEEEDLSAADIQQEISFELPKELTMADYDVKIGSKGGCIFQPDVYKSGSEIKPAEWTAAGMVSRYKQDEFLTWDGNSISNVTCNYARSIMEFLENVNDITAPAVLMHGNHQLYTEPEIESMQKTGFDPRTVDLTSDYWYLFIAKPGETYGYVITLNQKNYTRDDILALGKSIKLL